MRHPPQSTKFAIFIPIFYQKFVFILHDTRIKNLTQNENFIQIENRNEITIDWLVHYHAGKDTDIMEMEWTRSWMKSLLASCE